MAIYSSPALESSLTPNVALPAGLAEIAFLLWLLVKRANKPGLDERVPAQVHAPAVGWKRGWLGVGRTGAAGSRA